MKLRIVFVFSVLLLLGCIALHAFSVNLDPPSVQVILAPGESRSGVLTLTNQAKESARFKVVAQDWAYLPDGSKEFLPMRTTSYSCASWMSLGATSFTVEPGKDQALYYQIKAPKDAEGGYYGVVFFESLLGKNPENINVAGRIGTIFYVEIKDTQKKNGELKNVKVVTEKLPISEKAVTVSFSFKNLGNILMAPSGIIVAKDAEGQTLNTTEILAFKALPGDLLEKTYPLTVSAQSAKLAVILNMGTESPLVETVPLVVKKRPPKSP